MPTNPTLPPAQVAFVLTVVGLLLLAFVCMVILKAAIWMAERRAGVVYEWEELAPPEPGPLRQLISALAAATERRYTPRRVLPMSSADDRDDATICDPIYIPVSHTDMPAAGMTTAAPDIDAVNRDMPRLSRNITEDDELAFLCVVRNPDGKYRHSANAIYGLVGGDRNTVLAKIKAIRGAPPAPEFRQPDGSTAPASHPITK